MRRGYERFLRTGINLAPLGVAPGGEPYFCTPRGYSMIGSEGVDGVHYCFVRGYGETVFAVSPESAGPERVRAVARDFSDFLRLLLACGHGAAIEQCPHMTRAQFDAYLAENPVTDGQRAVLDEIAAALSLEPTPDPWAYIHGLQEGFDYGKIKYLEPEAAAEPAREAEADGAACFEPGGEPGIELPLNYRFEALGWRWTVAALVVCPEGLVLRLAREVAPEDFAAFMARCGLSFEDAGRKYSAAERMRIEAENPLGFDFDAALLLNGERLESSGSSGSGWISLDGAKHGPDSFLARYGLDPSRCWSFRSIRYIAPGLAPEDVRRLSLSLKPNPVDLPGEPFIAREGEVIELIHPVTGEKYALSVDEIRPERLDLRDDDYIYPKCCRVLRYTLTPDTDALLLRDVSEGDPARRRDGKEGFAGTIGVFGLSSGGGHTAHSALRFEMPPEVEWLPVWRVEGGESEEIRLL